MSNDNTKIAIVVSHQDRIRQFLETNFVNNPIYKPGKLWGQKEQKFRLMNGAVLKITYTPKNDNLLTINLIYSGELNVKNPKEDPYLISENDRNNDNIKKYTKNPFVFEDIYGNKKNLTGYQEKPDDNNTYIIYLVRHSDGIHNKDKGFKKNTGNLFSTKYLDAPLTDMGITQAFQSGIFICEDLKNFAGVNYMFASDLYRSRQTLDVICETIDINNINRPNNAIIVPCIHEILKNSLSLENKSNQEISKNEQNVNDEIKRLKENIDRLNERIETIRQYPNKDNDDKIINDQYLINENNGKIKEYEQQIADLMPKNDWIINNNNNNNNNNNDDMASNIIEEDDINRIDEDYDDYAFINNLKDKYYNEGKIKNFVSDWDYYNKFFNNKNRSVNTESICETYNLLDFILRIMMDINKLMPTMANGGKTVKRHNKRYKKYKTIKKKNNKKTIKRKFRINKKKTRRN